MLKTRHVRTKVLSALLALGATSASGTASAEFPTLDRAIQLARERAIVVAEAQAEVGVARAQMTGAKVSIFGNPYVDVQIDKGFSRSTELEVQALGYAYFPVDLTGQRGARIEEADKMIKWRELGLTNARGNATGEVVAAYGSMLLSGARMAQAAVGEQTARDEARYFSGRLEAKDATIYEKSLADAEVARWVQSRAEAELRFISAKTRFLNLTGGTTVDPPPETANVSPPPLRGSWDDAYVARVVDKSAPIARLDAERVYWEASVERYKAERIPPVAFELIGGRGELGEGRIGGGAVVTFPVTRRYQGEIARAASGRANAVNQLTLYRGIVSSGLKAARDAIVTVRKAVEELDQAGMPALERAVSSSNEAFKLGKVDVVRVLLARRDLALARSRRLELIENAWRAYADLAILTGDLP